MIHTPCWPDSAERSSSFWCAFSKKTISWQKSSFGREICWKQGKLAARLRNRRAIDTVPQCDDRRYVSQLFQGVDLCHAVCNGIRLSHEPHVLHCISLPIGNVPNLSKINSEWVCTAWAELHHNTPSLGAWLHLSNRCLYSLTVSKLKTKYIFLPYCQNSKSPTRLCFLIWLASSGICGP